MSHPCDHEHDHEHPHDHHHEGCDHNHDHDHEHEHEHDAYQELCPPGHVPIPFSKMHGIGNDFIVIDDLQLDEDEVATPLSHELAARLCNRHFGAGADQLLWLRPGGALADAEMKIFNSDGSQAEMCGNGIRAAAMYLMDQGPKPGKRLYQIQTDAGLKEIRILGEITESGDQRLYEVKMGIPDFENGEVAVDGKNYPCTKVYLGNPHAVFLGNPGLEQLESFGPKVQSLKDFPSGVNVELVSVLNPAELRVRVWERGAGATLACGTGACAAVVAAVLAGQVQSPAKVDLPGGSLQIRWDGPGHEVILSGPARLVFQAVYFVPFKDLKLEA